MRGLKGVGVYKGSCDVEIEVAGDEVHGGRARHVGAIDSRDVHFLGEEERDIGVP